MERMTDKEIKKALECCGNTDDGCLHCPLYGSPAPECGMRLCRESLELHKSQQAEIERLEKALEENESLKAKIKQLNNNISAMVITLSISAKETRAEAIKEFAERLKAETIEVDVSYGYGREHYTEAVAVIVIDNLVKEMVGEE